MDGALPSVVGGLVRAPVIAVPTSVGYGASFGGLSALLAMLNSCAAGVTVVQHRQRLRRGDGGREDPGRSGDRGAHGVRRWSASSSRRATYWRGRWRRAHPQPLPPGVAYERVTDPAAAAWRMRGSPGRGVRASLISSIRDPLTSQRSRRRARARARGRPARIPRRRRRAARRRRRDVLDVARCDGRRSCRWRGTTRIAAERAVGHGAAARAGLLGRGGGRRQLRRRRWSRWGTDARGRTGLARIESRRSAPRARWWARSCCHSADGNPVDSRRAQALAAASRRAARAAGGVAGHEKRNRAPEPAHAGAGADVRGVRPSAGKHALERNRGEHARGERRDVRRARRLERRDHGRSRALRDDAYPDPQPASATR